VRDVERIVRDEAGGRGVRISLANIGSPAWNFPVNTIYVFNAGPQEAVLLVALGEGEPAMPELERRIRARLARELPDVRVSFEAGDVVQQVMSFGARTPVHVVVNGKDLRAVRGYAERIEAELASDHAFQDVQIPIALDYPTLRVDIDRARAGQLASTADRVARDVVIATSSSVLTTPMFWTDPSSGQPYRVELRVPEADLRSANDLLALPIAGEAVPGRAPSLGEVASVSQVTTPGEMDHYDNLRSVSIDANLRGHDLAEAASRVRAALERAGRPPRGIAVSIGGQVREMERTLSSMRLGVLLAVIVVPLLLVAVLQSVRAALAVVSTIPAVLAGVLLALLVTGTSLAVMSMMGAITSIGVSVANAILLVVFARARRAAGDDRRDASSAAAIARFRPILMTSLAMIAGMIPVAIALGGGGQQAAPLGIAVIGGLSASTIATLLVLPAIDALLAPKSERRASLLPDHHEVMA
jgi:multidrug efflux pump subunit AcrB